MPSPILHYFEPYYNKVVTSWFYDIIMYIAYVINTFGSLTFFKKSEKTEKSYKTMFNNTNIGD